MARAILWNVLKALLLAVIVVLSVLFSTGQESRFIYTDF